MIILIIFLLLGGLFLGCCYLVFRLVFQSPNRTQNDDHSLPDMPQIMARSEEIHVMIDAVNALPWERVTARSHDGLTLCGRYYHQRDGAPLNICFHGYRGTSARDFSGGTQIMRRQGHNLLMVDERAHGASEGHTITFGVEERYDCLDWIRYAVERFGPETRIVLVGISMGAATVLMASALSLPEQVVGIVADCPYTSPQAIIRKVAGDMGIPPRAAGILAGVSARIFGHFRLVAVDAAKAAGHTTVPILLIHGEDDRFVPCAMSREIYAANPEIISLFTFPGAGHGLSYLADAARYEALIRDFSRRILPEEINASPESPEF